MKDYRGPMCTATLMGREVRVVVRSRPDLSSVEGAADADRLGDVLVDAAKLPGVDQLYLDVVDGPVVSGPVTERFKLRFLAAFAQAGKPVFVRCGPSAIKRLQWQRLLSATLGPLGHFVDGEEGAAVATR